MGSASRALSHDHSQERRAMPRKPGSGASGEFAGMLACGNVQNGAFLQEHTRGRPVVRNGGISQPEQSAMPLSFRKVLPLVAGVLSLAISWDALPALAQATPPQSGATSSVLPTG